MSNNKINSEKKEKSKYQIVKTTAMIVDNILYEQIYDCISGVCQFISWNDKEKKYGYNKEVIDELRKIRYVTKCEENKWVKNGYIPLPSMPEDYQSFENLVSEICTYTKKYLDIEDEKIKLNAYIIILSWIIEKINTIAYIRGTGLSGNGKTRFIDVYGNIAYKPIFMVNPHVANIYRLIDDFQNATIVINEDTSKSNRTSEQTEEKINLFTLLNSGFQRGFPVPRCVDKDNNVVPFDPFGLKILTSYSNSCDSAFESRCINTELLETERDLQITLDDDFDKEAMHIRNMLLDFKMKNFNVDFSEYNRQTFSFWGETISKRVAQCLQPISLLIHFDPSIKDFLISVGEQKYIEQISYNSETFDGQIFRHYIELVNEKQSCNVCIRELKVKLESKYPDIKPRSIASSLKAIGLQTQRGYLDNKKETIILPNVKNVRIRSKVYLFPDERDMMLKNYENFLNHIRQEEKPNQKSQQKLAFSDDCIITEDEYNKSKNKA